jgi:alkanesulfonate monooxygenase SsuD/methylene tetrahydromethanopterin reductase-like flavin-dependent oxidoreductase (luciferase family)
MTYELVKNLALTAERLGYHSIFSNDHLVRGEGGYILEGWTVLSALAAITTRIRLGNLVLCNAFRYPQLLAKMSSTLDVISGGRFELGIGSGWLADEFIQYNIPFPKPAVRIAQLREALEVIKRMWTLDRASYQGKYYVLRDAICEPKPIQKPYPPILVGGGGERLTLKVVAECADICNFGGSPAGYTHKLDILRQHCERVGRSFDEIELSWTGDFIIAASKEALAKKIQMIKPKRMALEDYVRANIVGTPEACLRKVQEYLGLGVTYFTIGGFSKLREPELKLIAETVMSHL